MRTTLSERIRVVGWTTGVRASSPTAVLLVVVVVVVPPPSL